MLRVVARPWCDRVLTADLGWQRSGADSDTSELLRKRIDQVILRNSQAVHSFFCEILEAYCESLFLGSG